MRTLGIWKGGVGWERSNKEDLSKMLDFAKETTRFDHSPSF